MKQIIIAITIAATGVTAHAEDNPYLLEDLIAVHNVAAQECIKAHANSAGGYPIASAPCLNQHEVKKVISKRFDDAAYQRFETCPKDTPYQRNAQCVAEIAADVTGLGKETFVEYFTYVRRVTTAEFTFNQRD